MTQEQLTELMAQAFNEGQVKGIQLACDMLSKAILEFKDKTVEMFNKEKKNSE